MTSAKTRLMGIIKDEDNNNNNAVTKKKTTTTTTKRKRAIPTSAPIDNRPHLTEDEQKKTKAFLEKQIMDTAIAGLICEHCEYGIPNRGAVYKLNGKNYCSEFCIWKNNMKIPDDDTENRCNFCLAIRRWTQESNIGPTCSTHCALKLPIRELDVTRMKFMIFLNDLRKSTGDPTADVDEHNDEDQEEYQQPKESKKSKKQHKSPSSSSSKQKVYIKSEPADSQSDKDDIFAVDFE